MGRERQPFKRVGFFRETQKLVVIASEGTETEVQYFEEFKSSNLYNDANIFIETLNRYSQSSSPKSVLATVKGFKKAYDLKLTDELWVLIDRDKQSWKIPEIDHVAQQCNQGRIGFAMSNPCFELWILLHLTDLDTFSAEELAEMLENKKINKNRTWIEKKLSELLEGYNKTNIRSDRFINGCYEAVSRAEKLDVNPQHRWPNGLGTHVYKLFKQVLKQA
jgi:hypothetical protein